MNLSHTQESEKSAPQHCWKEVFLWAAQSFLSGTLSRIGSQLMEQQLTTINHSTFDKKASEENIPKAD